MINKSKWNSTLLSLMIIICVGLIGLTGCGQATKDISTNDIKVEGSFISNTENQNASAKTNGDAISTDPAYFGEWIINQVQAYGVGTYSTEDAESLVGESLTFTANKASHFGDRPSNIEKVATNPIYTETILSESDFVERYRIPFDILGIKGPTITEISVSDSNGPVSTFLIKDDNTLIISGGGTYFELIRKVTKKDSASTDSEILIIIDQTSKPKEEYSFDFVVKQVPEGFALAEMQWITPHTIIANSVQDAIEHGANGEFGFYISGDGQYSGFIFPDYLSGQEGQVVFIFKDANGNELTWKKELTL